MSKRVKSHLGMVVEWHGRKHRGLKTKKSTKNSPKPQENSKD